MIVFLCCSWSFSTFDHNFRRFLFSSFFLKVWISLSIRYRRTFALTWAPSFPNLPIVIYWYPYPPLKCKRNNWMPPFLFLCNILRKKWVMKLIFCMQILSILMGMVKRSQSTWNNKFAIPSHYLKKKIRDGIHSLHANKHQSFYKLAILFLMQVARHVQSTQNRKLAVFLQYIKKKVLQLFLCSIVIQNI